MAEPHDHDHSHGKTPGHGHGHGHGGPVVWDPDAPQRQRGVRYVVLGVVLIVVGLLIWWWGAR